MALSVKFILLALLAIVP